MNSPVTEDRLTNPVEHREMVSKELFHRVCDVTVPNRRKIASVVGNTLCDGIDPVLVCRQFEGPGIILESSERAELTGGLRVERSEPGARSVGPLGFDLFRRICELVLPGRNVMFRPKGEYVRDSR